MIKKWQMFLSLICMCTAVYLQQFILRQIGTDKIIWCIWMPEVCITLCDLQQWIHQRVNTQWSILMYTEIIDRVEVKGTTTQNEFLPPSPLHVFTLQGHFERHLRVSTRCTCTFGHCFHDIFTLKCIGHHTKLLFSC